DRGRRLARRAPQRRDGRAAGGSERAAAAPDLGEGAVRVTAFAAAAADGRRGQTMDRTYTIEELWAAVRRRWKSLALVAGGVLVLAALVIARLPNEYRARALVMVEPFTPHPDLVVPVVNSLNLESKVKSVREGVYARSIMVSVLEVLKLYARELEKRVDDSVICLTSVNDVPLADL